MVYLSKPPWVKHNGRAILSVDFHPNGKYFATCGIDCKVKIWDLMSLLQENEEDDVDVEELQKTNVIETISLPRAVNSVRWSHKGDFLAVGADNETVSLYRQRGSEEGRYVRAHTGKGHTGDVTCVEWSWDDRYLASASIDNTVRIWDIEKGFFCIAVLEGHSGYVNGIAWDPVMQYVATQSDDKTVKVWRINGWKLETTIEYLKNVGHYKQVPSEMYYFRRLSWSPDGRYLATPHGFKQGNHVVFILKRNTWSPHVEFAGHSKSVVVASFNNRVFRTKSDKGESDQPQNSHFSLIADGGLDGTITLWTTTRTKALVAFTEAAKSGITDISWSSCGMQLFASSSDGSITYLRFDHDDIGGSPLDLEEQRQKLKEVHSYTYKHLNGMMVPLEGITELSMEKSFDKKRVPLEKEKLDLEKVEKHIEAARSTTLTKSEGTASKFGASKIPEGTVVHTLIPKRKKQISGKGTSDNADEPFVKRMKLVEEGQHHTSSGTDTGQIYLAPQSIVKPVDCNETEITVEKSVYKKKLKCQISPLRSEKGVGKKRTVSCEIIKLPEEFKKASGDLPFSRTRVIGLDDDTGETLWIDYLPYEAFFIVGTSYFVTIACNPVGVLYILSPSGIRLFPPIILGSEILLVRSMEDILLCLTKDGSIKIWKLQSFGANNPFTSPQILKGESSSRLLYSISMGALVEYESLKGKKGKLKELRISNLDLVLKGGDAKAKEGSNNVGVIVSVTFSNHSKYIWNPDIQEWISHGKRDFYASDYYYSKAVLDGVPFLSTKFDFNNPDEGNSSMNQRLTYLSKIENVEQERLSLAHLECMIAQARSLKDSERMKHWFTIYVKRLTNNAEEVKLREILNYLLWLKDKEGYSEVLLELNKMELFEEVLRIVSSNRNLQRLSHQFYQTMKNQELIKQTLEINE